MNHSLEIEQQIKEENAIIVRDIIGVKDSDSTFSAFWMILDWEQREDEEAWSSQPSAEEYEEMWANDDEP
jgi:hypothetical protein